MQEHCSPSLKRRRPTTLVGLLVLGGAFCLTSPTHAQGWLTYAQNSQHTAPAPVAASPYNAILWSASVDHNPGSGELLIHYGSPLITDKNTVIVTVKIGTSNITFQVEGHRAADGSTLWTQATDYSLPPNYDWTPSCGSAITGKSVAIPAAGGTILLRSKPDKAKGKAKRIAFYGIKNYNANPTGFSQHVQISTPITPDGKGNLYFGFMADGSDPLHMSNGIARVSTKTGKGSWVSAPSAAGDSSIRKVLYNCAPALGNNNTLYFAVNDANANGYLLGLDATTLATKYKIRCKDPSSGFDAILTSNASSSPTIGPDGDVYYGVLENPFPANNDRGWMLHFDSTLTQSKIPGAFGWDDTASVVPASAVPSYTGTSSYLILTKYNNYAGVNSGNGVNKVAVLDPNATEIDPVTGATVMNEVITVTGVTPDTYWRNNGYPNAVREWCINTAAVDAFSKCAIINSEDGVVYRWDFTTNTLLQRMTLTAGVGEAYTPTLVGPDGTIYAINDATLFAVGN